MRAWVLGDWLDPLGVKRNSRYFRQLKVDNDFMEPKMKEKEWIVFPGMRDCFVRYVSMAINYLAESNSVKNTPIIIMGDSGVGKSLFIEVAKEIFAKANSESISSLEKKHKIKRVNCASFSKELAESEIFGHVKGAYTGATCNKAGIVEVMDGGLLILDEIGELPEEVQAKLLIFIEEGEYRNLGSHEVKKAKVKVIGTTNKEHKKFRNDFWFRFYPIFIPPLHERRLDVLYYIAVKYPDVFKRLTPKHALSLLSYNWIGNMREVDRVVSLMLIEDRFDAIKKGAMATDRKKLFFPVDQRQTPLAKIYLNDFCKVLLDKKFDLNSLNSIIACYGLGVPYSFSTQDGFRALIKAMHGVSAPKLEKEQVDYSRVFLSVKIGDEIIFEPYKSSRPESAKRLNPTSFIEGMYHGFSFEEFLNEMKCKVEAGEDYYQRFDGVDVISDIGLGSLDCVTFVKYHELIERAGACLAALCKLFLRNVKSQQNLFGDMDRYVGDYWIDSKIENSIIRSFEKVGLVEPALSIVTGTRVIIGDRYSGVESWGEYIQGVLGANGKSHGEEISVIDPCPDFSVNVFEGTEKDVLTSYYKYLLGKYKRDKSVFKHADVNDSTCRHRLEKLGLLPRK